MAVYMDLVILLNFGVDILLLMGSAHLAGYRCGWLRAAAAAAVGGVYAGICLLPGFWFLQDLLWRMIVLALMSVIAFGYGRSALRRSVLFVFLSMALGGAATGIQGNDFVTLLLCAGGILLLCMIGVGGRLTGREYVPVELVMGEKRFRLTALKDTGNTLTDPITGQQVLLVSSDVAWDILGLTQQQLSDPVKTMEAPPVAGMRLIPYRAVGRESGFMLAMAMDAVRVGGQFAGKIVAFAPNTFQDPEGYQALTGGMA